MREIDCAYVDEHDLVALYLVGALADDEAEAFEAHHFACEKCWSDLRRAGEIRAAMGKPAIVPAPESPKTNRGRELSTLLAAAAAVAIVGLGLWQLARKSAEVNNQPVLRGGAAEALSVKAESDASGHIRLSWASHRAAQLYVVKVIRSDGVTVLTRETSDTSLTLDRASLAIPQAGVSFATRIEAFDPRGQVVAASELTPLP